MFKGPQSVFVRVACLVLAWMAGPSIALAQPDPRIEVNAANTPGDADSVYRITQPGSYILESNIVGVAGKHGVEIAASGVTLDLNGFEIRGVGGAGAFDGVAVAPGALFNIAVVNGAIRDWSDCGIGFFNPGILNARFEDLIVTGNGQSGIQSGFFAAITECLVNDNGNHGIDLGYGGSVVQCTASGNNGVGIATGYGCTINRCTVTYNNYYGIDAGTGSSVANCTVRYNTWDGIRVNAECTVRDNTCTRNGWGYTGTAITGAGIRLHTSATGCRVEGNNCTFQKRGVHVEAAGNFITRNTCKGNATNWQIVAGNACLVVNAVVSGAITGNAGGVSPGSSDPNANFTY